MTSQVSRRPRLKPVLAAFCALVVLGVSFGLYWFQPWRLLTDTTVTEELAVVPTAGPGSPVARGPVVLAQGSFVTHEHATTGVARVVRASDGTRRLELVGLDTSDGPDLRVWLSDQEVRPDVAGWRVFDDGVHAELGRLKGNRGDQTYRIGAEVDLDEIRSVSIWCKRFSVSFGAAALSA
ncbi:DM13 domain-containing protein [Actinoplanes sp. NPDC051494]|uniref:DM13 domain-containing protein n=1 Tax=Actinoplanes sp. NPDC051494 TaxID=3363907 RepID=UPI00378FF3DB